MYLIFTDNLFFENLKHLKKIYFTKDTQKEMVESFNLILFAKLKFIGSRESNSNK